MSTDLGEGLVLQNTFITNAELSNALQKDQLKSKETTVTFLHCFLSTCNMQKVFLSPPPVVLLGPVRHHLLVYQLQKDEEKAAVTFSPLVLKGFPSPKQIQKSLPATKRRETFWCTDSVLGLRKF